MTLSKLSMRQLIDVLKHLKGGSIGFDPFRNAETNTKDKLTAFIAVNYNNAEIINAVAAITGETASPKQAEAAPKTKPVRIGYRHSGAGMEETGALYFETLAEAHRWRDANTPVPYMVCSIEDNTPKTTTETAAPKFEETYSAKFQDDSQDSASFDQFFESVKKAEAIEKLKAEIEAQKQRMQAQSAANAIPDNAQALGQQIAALIAASQPKSQSVTPDQVQDMIMTAIKAYDATSFDEERAYKFCEEILKEEIAKLDRPTKVTVEIKATGEVKAMGLQHKNFPLLLKACQATQPDGHRLNFWLKGPAGSGKTTAAKNIAKALNLPFHFNGAIDTKYDLTGFIDAAGNYHRTAFREAFEHGGVYLFDEVDSSSPSAVLAFNAALANGIARFPDGNIERHKDCVILAGANTTGQGASSEYVGRFKQDAAFLDRFVLIDWPLDEKLERAFSQDTAWVKRVQEVRKATAKRNLKNHMVSPRATLYGSALLAAGIDLDQVEAMTLRKGLAEETWKEIAQ